MKDQISKHRRRVKIYLAIVQETIKVHSSFECSARGIRDTLSVNLANESPEHSMDIIMSKELTPSLIPTTDLIGNCPTNVRSVSHLTSNGYYGFVPYNIQNYTEPQHNKTLNFANTFVNKHIAPTYPTTKEVDSKTVHDSTCSMMDVQQQEQVLVDHSARGEACSVVDSVFLNAKTMPTQGATLKEGSGPNLHRLKRVLTRDEDEQDMRMECGITKRFRYSCISCLVSNNDELNPSFTEMSQDKDIVMDYGDLPVQHLREIDEVNSTESQDTHSIVDHTIDPLVPLTNINKCNAKYVDISRCVTSHMV